MPDVEKLRSLAWHLKDAVRKFFQRLQFRLKNRPCACHACWADQSLWIDVTASYRRLRHPAFCPCREDRLAWLSWVIRGGQVGIPPHLLSMRQFAERLGLAR